MRRRATIGWATYIATGAIVDLWRDRQNDESTLSATTRRVFHTDTLVGSRVFSTAAGAAGGYFIAHILRPKGGSR